ncbi:MAG: hypothetical protein IPI49_09915 [Myxococcales bacterium]|nr:hypothetical protein [Myxococcales bacterium]
MKQHSWAMRAGLAAVAVAAAAGTASAVGAEEGETCSPWGCGSNTPVLWGIPIVGLNLDGVANADGVKLDRRLWKPEAGGLRDTGCVLEVRDGSLAAGSPPGGKCLSSVIGLVFSLQVPRSKGCDQKLIEVKVRIAASGEVASWDLDARAAAVPTYRLVWHDLHAAREVLAASDEVLEPREDESVCPMRQASWMEAWQTHTSVWQFSPIAQPVARQRFVPISPKSPWFAKTDHLLVMQGETYTKDSSIDPARRGDRWFNFGCAGTAIAKLRLLGYEPLRTGTGSADERQAALKMITARYRGVRSYTSGGVAVVWKHKSNKRIAGQPAPESLGSSGRSLLLESHWGAAGARCLSHRRTWFALIASAKDFSAALDRALPEVSSHTRESLLMRHGSVDYLGAEQRSLEELRERGLPTCEATPAGDAPWTTYVVRHAHP